MKIEIFLYGKEALIFRKMLKKNNEDSSLNYSWDEKHIVGETSKRPGIKFTIESSDPIVFYFLGQEFERLRIKEILEHHAFTIPED